MAVLKPSINVFALLESNDPGDTRLSELRTPGKDDAAASRPVNINKKQQPQMSVWKANKVKAETNAAKNKQQQPAASKAKAKTNSATNAGQNRKPPQQTGTSKAQVTSTAANAGKNIKRPQQPTAPKAQVYAAANAPRSQFQQLLPLPQAKLTQILFGNAYPSARELIYKNRKQNAPANNAKDGVAGGAPAEDKKGGHPNGAVVKGSATPAPVQEEPPAPVKPVLPPPPPPSLDDSAQFPSLK